MNRLWPAVLIWGALVGGAQAHLMTRGHATLNVVKDTAYVVMSVPITVFALGPAGAAVIDGVLTATELKANDAALQAAIRSGLTVSVGGKPARFGTIVLNLPQGEHHAPGQSDEVTAMIVVPLGGVPESITVSNRLWGEHAQQLKIQATVSEGRRTLRKEVFELTAKVATHRFFAPSKAP